MINLESITISTFLFLAAVAYGWIGINFAVDDRKINKVISPLMLTNFILYVVCIFYTLNYKVVEFIVFLIFSQAFWGLSIIPFANQYFNERLFFQRVSKSDLLQLIVTLSNLNNSKIEDIVKGMPEYKRLYLVEIVNHYVKHNNL